MAYTFSEYPATTYYAENKTALQDVLQLLPDNTSKEITPRDVRDAVLSAWESNVFKYVNGVNEYIGFTRDEIKDKKIFFGKKQISGSNIMSSSLLTSDTDIFLYNTKSDFASPQDFKMGFLAGTDTSLFEFAPYIQSTQVSGGNPHISLNLINPATYGRITIQSGSSASVVINNLYWPSTAQVAASIASPLSSNSNDLFLVMRGNGSPNYLELRTYTSLGGQLGSTGSTTTILGSPTTLNGHELEYTNPDPIVQSIGGVTVGTTFSSLAFSLLFDQILYPTLGPFASINITSAGSPPTPLSQNRTFERNHNSPTSVYISYSVIKRTNDVTSTYLRAQRPNGVFAVDDGTGFTPTGPGLITSNNINYTYTVPASAISGNTQFGIFTFSVVPNDSSSLSFTASQTVEFVFPYIYSFDTVNRPLTTFDMNALFGVSYNKIINSYGSQSIPLSNPTIPKYLYFMYPSHYGLLSEILDGNNFSESLSGPLAAWTFSQNVNISEPFGRWLTQPYNIYRKTELSIMPPSQDYKFNF
jgi:hypothetical protein